MISLKQSYLSNTCVTVTHQKMFFLGLNLILILARELNLVQVILSLSFPHIMVFKLLQGTCSVSYTEQR